MPQIYRLSDAVAVSITGATRYLTVKEARKMRQYLGRVIRSIEREKFTESKSPGGQFKDWDLHEPGLIK